MKLSQIEGTWSVLSRAALEECVHLSAPAARDAQASFFALRKGLVAGRVGALDVGHAFEGGHTCPSCRLYATLRIIDQFDCGRPTTDAPSR